jgi:uncharacterized protein (UPF0335 family)
LQDKSSSSSSKEWSGWRKIKKAISGDIRDVYAEMKGRGFDVRAVREIVKIRKRDFSQRKEMEAVIELCMSALNMN